ncbi:MAG: hypothetical protein ACOCQG_00240 [Candidatus Nanoarchaeia archaeon]
MTENYETNDEDSQEATKKIYSNIDRIMDLILEDKMDSAISLLVEAKEIYKDFKGNEIDSSRINEELAELTNLIKYSGRLGDEALKERIKKTKEAKTVESRIDRNKAMIDEIYSLIDELMDALAIDDRKTAAKLMVKIKKLYTWLDGYVVDKHRIYEEVSELKKILYEREN